MKRLRQTKKLRQLMAYAQAHKLGSVFAGAVDHDDLYWRAAVEGLAYDSDAGWYVAETPAAAPGSPFSVRLEGSHAALVAAEKLLRTAGVVVTKRDGPSPGRGGVWLTYADCKLPGAGRRRV